MKQRLSFPLLKKSSLDIQSESEAEFEREVAPRHKTPVAHGLGKMNTQPLNY